MDEDPRGALVRLGRNAVLDDYNRGSLPQLGV